MEKKATLICDMAYGSTGKGLIAGYLAERDRPDVAVTAWSLNAGHTYINAQGRKFVHCMLANAVVSPELRHVLIGPGSCIGIDKLFEEAQACRDLLGRAKIYIHEHAAVIQERHIAEENAGSTDMTGIGSTKKGVGAATIEKIRREAKNDQIVAKHFAAKIQARAASMDLPIQVVNRTVYNTVLTCARRVLIEGAQGFSLGINSGFYPYTTSRECTPAQIASDCAVPLPMIKTVVGTMRTYPIRVANRYDAAGNMIGYSGPCYDDQRETSFDDIAQAVEHTTVTKLPRRIFTFSEQQSWDAMFTVRPDEVVMGFANYASPEYLKNVMDTVHKQATALNCGAVRYQTWGPSRLQVRDLSEDRQGVLV